MATVPSPARWGDLGRLVVAWVVGTISLAVAGRLLPGLGADHWFSYAIAAAVVGVVGAIVRPVLTLVAAVIGWLGLAALALVGQAVVMHLALWVVPGIHAASFWTTFAAAWITAILVTFVEWVGTAGTADSLVATLSREVRTGRRDLSLADPEMPGVLFVQLDGVPFPLLQWALQSGLMPTVRRWVDSGSHVAREWLVQLPCTTPASQLGILHGTSAGIPAFRWHDRELGRVLVANRPADAKLIEARASTGAGLLADDGASVSNLFSGDAVQCSMVMSRVGLTRGSLSTRRALAGFMARPDGLARSLSRALAEIGRERYQSRRQHRRDVVPRIHRPWAFTGLRAVTNGLLRDVNLVVVARELRVGRRTVYVDFVDYDEVAHHAGPTRLESLAVLSELDRTVDVLARLVALAPRPYEIVMLSDHGQSMGQPFAARYGLGLDDLCRELMGSDVEWFGENVESWGRAGSIAEDVAASDAGSGLADSVVRHAREQQQHDGQQHGEAGPIVLGSGNLGLIYVGGSERLTLEDLDKRWPRLSSGLAAHEGIGFVAAVSEVDGPVVLGAGGRRRLRPEPDMLDRHDLVEGEDPLAGYGDHAARVLLTALDDPAAPDLYVNSALDASTQEVAAFEELVGCHGGLGGWQDRAMVVAPTHLWRAEHRIEGAAALHLELVGMLERLGHRGDLRHAVDDAAEGVA